MKKSDSLLYINNPRFDSKSSYYRQIGEEAALNTFTKNKFRHKLKTISPPSKLNFSKEDMLRLDRETRALMSPLSRDISHIRDKFSSPPPQSFDIHNPNQAELPLDIHTIEKLIKSSDKYGIPLHQGFQVFSQCRKDKCLENVLKTCIGTPEIDQLYLGQPSGRQECDNLNKWIKIMKVIHCKDENTSENEKIIYTMASKELIRQVSVHCIERGELLKEVIEYFSRKSEESKKFMQLEEKKTERLRNRLVEEFKEKENMMSVKVKKMEENIEAYSLRIQQRNEIIEELSEKVQAGNDKIEELLLRVENGDQPTLRVYSIYRTSPSIVKKTSNLSKTPISGTRLKSADVAVQTVIDFSFYRLQERKALINSKHIQTDAITLSIYRDSCGIEILSQNCFKDFEKDLKEIEKKELSTHNSLIDYVETKDFEIALSIDSHTDIKSKDMIIESLKNTSQNLYQSDDIKLKAVKTMQKKDKTPKKKSSKNKNTTILEVENPELLLKEKDEKLKELSNIIEEQSYQIDILKSIDESRRQSLIPTITINEPINTHLSPNFDLLSFQSGYQSGFNNGYDLGLNTVLNQKEARDSLNISNSEFWNDEESFEHAASNSPQHLEKKSTLQISHSEKMFIEKESVNEGFIKLMSENQEKLDINKVIELPKRKIIMKGKTHETLFTPSHQNQARQHLELGLSHILESSFNKKSLKEDHHSVHTNLLGRLLSKSLKWIKKKATMSKKMVNKLMSSFYMSYYLRFDFSVSLLYFIYDDFLQKSGLKKAGEKKFVQFISSLISFHHSRRAKVFLQFISAGKIINEPNFSQFSLKFYLDCMNFMQTARIGISYIDDTLDKILLPLIRCVECVKEKLEDIDKAAVSRTINLVEKEAVPDPKKINNGGLVDNEFVLESIIMVYEEHQKNIMQGIDLILRSINYNEDQSVITKDEAYGLIRILYPLKLEEFDACFSMEIIQIDDFCMFCIEKSIFSLKEINNFLEYDRENKEETEIIIDDGVKEVYSLLNRVQSLGNIAKPLSIEKLEMKLRVLTTERRNRDQYEILLALFIFKNQLLRIN